MPAPGAAPGSVLVRTNLATADGDPAEAAGAITFSSPPSGFTFVGNNEFEEHQALEVPAGGSVSLSYIYSTGYTVAQVQAPAWAAHQLVMLLLEQLLLLRLLLGELVADAQPIELAREQVEL